MNTKPPGSAFPFAGNVLESLELMGKAWGTGFSQVPGFPTPASMASALPSMMVPTLDVNELDKRIADLRAVEQWLALNANMLRASIQALEVQRNTIATLQTLGATMMNPSATGQPAKGAGQAPWPPQPAPSPASAQAPSATTFTSKRAKRPAGPETPTANFADMPLNPAAWWSNLQDQFTRIAAAAAGEQHTTAAAAPKPTASKDDGKPAARRPPTKRTS
jgi:hypothetical protein